MSYLASRMLHRPWGLIGFLMCSQLLACHATVSIVLQFNMTQSIFMWISPIVVEFESFMPFHSSRGPLFNSIGPYVGWPIWWKKVVMILVWLACRLHHFHLYLNVIWLYRWWSYEGDPNGIFDEGNEDFVWVVNMGRRGALCDLVRGINY